MKLIAIIEVPDDMYDDYQDWYITSGDDLEIRYEEDGSYMHFKTLGDDIKLKPLPQMKDERRVIYGSSDGFKKDYILGIHITEHTKGWNACIDEILGEGE